MTFQKFLEKHNGKYVEVAGSPNAEFQCTDLANLYIRDVLNLPIIEWTNAVDFPKKWKHEWIKNTPEGLPQEGDLIVWKTNHIAAFIEGNTSSFRSFDQNYPIGSPCHVQGHSYSNVAGWMRYNKPEEPIEEPSMTEEKRIIQFLKEKDKFREGDVREMYGALLDVVKVKELLKSSESLRKSLEESNKRLEAVNFQKTSRIAELAKGAETAKKVLVKKDKEISNLDAQKNQYRLWYEKALKRDVDKLNSWEHFLLFIKKLSWKSEKK